MAPLVNEGDMRVEDVTTPGPTGTMVEAEPLSPPQALFRPISYPALHIFVSTASYLMYIFMACLL